MQTLRVVCYLNPFFGQLGGEDKAGIGPRVMSGAVGAARAVQQALGEAGTHDYAEGVAWFGVSALPTVVFNEKVSLVQF